MTYKDLRENNTVREYIRKADESLLALGYTEHSFAHVGKVADTAAYILSTLNYSEHDIELARIAAWLHDIGNLVNRDGHAQSGALMAFRILDKMDLDASDIATVVTAIGNHDESNGVAVNAISAALILADKSDVRRSRVRNNDISTFDIHDRVNYSVTSSEWVLDANNGLIDLHLTVDTAYGSIMDYFEIFLHRMIMCRHAAEKLSLRFGLYINEQRIL